MSIIAFILLARLHPTATISLICVVHPRSLRLMLVLFSQCFSSKPLARPSARTSPICNQTVCHAAPMKQPAFSANRMRSARATVSVSLRMALVFIHSITSSAAQIPYGPLRNVTPNVKAVWNRPHSASSPLLSLITPASGDGVLSRQLLLLWD